MSIVPPYTITNESIMLVWEGKPYTFQKGTPQFLALKAAIMTENWEAIPKNLTVANSLSEWAKGKITVTGEVFYYDGEQLPTDINRRIIQMATKNEDPSPLFKFWERLRKNPSYRSVKQLFGFLQHEGIPFTQDGCFLAYKAVKTDYTDVHSGQFSNRPGVTNEMPRNKISDDPQVACHEGFHVGALKYAETFHTGGRIVVCKVDPEDVVCVPFDSSQRKMRVCKYEVIGNHNGEVLPSTTFQEEIDAEKESNEGPEDPDYLDDEDGEDFDEVEGFVDSVKPEEVKEPKANEKKKVPEKKPSPETKRSAVKEFSKMDKMDMKQLIDQSIEELRRYASKGLLITGASKIPGGKVALVAKILEVRR